GLRVGDVIIAVDDQRLPAGKDTAGALDAARRGAELAGRTLRLTVARGGTPTTVEIQPLTQCDQQGRIKPKNTVDPPAGRNGVTVYTGLLRFVSDDNELAFVLGHEISHNIMESVGWRQPAIDDSGTHAFMPRPTPPGRLAQPVYNRDFEA